MPLLFWFDLFLEARAEILFVDLVTLKGHFEINWPLELLHNTYQSISSIFNSGLLGNKGIPRNDNAVKKCWRTFQPPKAATDMDQLHTDFRKSETSKNIKNQNNIIWTPSKVVLICKSRRVWLLEKTQKGYSLLSDLFTNFVLSFLSTYAYVQMPTF